MIDSMMKSRLFQVFVVWFALTAFLIAALNCPRDQVKVRYWQDRWSSPSNATFGQLWVAEQESLGRSYGWPFSIPLHSAGAVAPREALPSIAWNLIFGLIACVVATFTCGSLHLLVKFRHGLLEYIGRKQILIATVSIAMVACAVIGVGIVRVRKILNHQQLVQRLRPYGTVGMAFEAPAVLVSRLPAWAMYPFFKIESFDGSVDGLEIIKQFDSAPNLRLVAIQNSAIADDVWQTLFSDWRVQEVRLSDCEVQFSEVASIHNTTLQKFSMIQCSGADAIIPMLRHCDQLRSVLLSRSSLNDLSGIGDALPPQVQEVVLTLEIAAGSKLELKGLDQLKSLKIESAFRSSPSDYLALRLVDLPRLEACSVSSSIGLDMQALRLPRLRKIEAIGYVRGPGYAKGAGYTTYDQASLPARILLIDNLPCLQQLRLSGDHLKRFQFINTPNLKKLSIGTTSFLGKPEWEYEPIDPNAWIADLADCDGPTSIDLSDVSLVGVDFTPLQHNPRIKEMILANTGVSLAQINHASRDGHIKSFDLRGCDLSKHELDSLLSSTPNIQRLVVDTEHLSEIHIVNQPRLTHLLGSSVDLAKAVQIIDCPQLTGALVLGDKIETFEIRGAQSLNAISMRGPLPVNAILEGIRDLSIAEFPGNQFTDSHLRSVLNCQSLSELILDNPSVSPGALSEIGQLTNLSVLRVPGAPVTDEVVANWRGLRNLREIDLSETTITGQSLKTLAQLPNLQRISVNDTTIDSSDIAVIAQLQSLLELELAGSSIQPQTLIELLNPYRLERINLSGTVLAKAIVEVLASETANHLMFLGLSHCGLSDADVCAITDANPELALDISGNDVSIEVVRRLSQAGRLIASSDRLGFERYLQDLDGNVTNSRWLGSQAAKKQFATRPYASLDVASFSEYIDRQRSKRSPILARQFDRSRTFETVPGPRPWRRW